MSEEDWFLDGRKTDDLYDALAAIEDWILEGRKAGIPDAVIAATIKRRVPQLLRDEPRGKRG